MRKVLPIILIAVLLGTSAAILMARSMNRRSVAHQQNLEVHFVDVGNGDCVLLRTPDRRTILINAGNEESGQKIVDYLSRFGIRQIDAVVLTDWRSDHTGGLPAVLDRFGVSEVIDTGNLVKDDDCAESLGRIESRRITRTPISGLQRIDVGNNVDMALVRPLSSGRTGSRDSALVLRIVHGDIGFLLTGDATAAEEGRILATREDLRCTVLQVSNHGDERSTSNELLQVVQPEYAVISTGADQSFKHPGEGILDRLEASGALLLRTDVHGSIVFSTDGTKIDMVAER